MSSGSRVTGAQTYSYTGCGYAWVGSISREAWSGNDSPDPQHRSENVYSKTWSSEVAPWFGFYYVDENGNYVWGSRGGTYSSCGFGGLSQAGWFLDDNDTLNLQSKILSKVKGSDLNLSVSLAEGKETYSLIKNSTLSVWKAFRSVRKGRLSEGFRFLRQGNLHNGRRIPRRPPKALFQMETASAWLAMRYGWQPLLNDIYQGLLLIQNREAHADASYTRFRSSVSRSKVTQIKSPGLPSSKQEVICRYSVIAKVNTSYLTSFRTLAACGVVDPEVVAWELLPYSFVVDWFLPVGTYLEDRAAIPRLSCTFIFGKKRSSKWGNLTSTGDKPGYRLYGDYASSSLETGSFDRIIGSSWPVPLPSFRNPLSGTLKHVVDALALWRVRI